ncbi:hypothetical protein [Streptomyces broussonetiae]|uniref:Uncharacterized protein n=1 Tax=Streptomyces broussonetiae TaxID=2686304 RepID=A0A6I6NF98_9ACTN|nr:hypothetical protein [Streptomyces broussonetiae]QHA09011.1 hypothetical protein GQF42_42480 [Streptomyces broussonetiae]
MAYQLGDLGRLFHDQMYNVLAGGDANVPPAKDAFITWCTPGLPYQPADFTFAAQGIGTGATAEEDKVLLQQAFNFASLIDFIPDATAAYSTDRQEGVWRNASGARLSEIYGQILKFSKVVNDELTDEQKQKLEKFRGLLRVTRTVKDIVTDEEKQVTEDSPMLKAYKAGMQAYIAAALNYNNKRIAAEAAVGEAGKAAVADWANNAQLYQMQLSAAMDDWTSNGYRNDVDEINAYINQVTEKSMLLWKQHLEQMYNDAIVNALTPGERFFSTTVVPGDFASAEGWTGYSMYHQMIDSSHEGQTTSWSAGGGVNWGLWSASAGVTETSSQYSESFQLDDFTLSFDMTQVQIVRPWFFPEFLENRGWDLRKGEGWNYDDMPSDGGSPPKGRFIGYPLQALFIKDLTIHSAQFAQAFSSYSNSTSVNASVGWGPFTLNGSYSHAESGDHFHSESDGATISVPGMQIIGFVNHLLGKTPNLLDGISQDQLV